MNDTVGTGETPKEGTFVLPENVKLDELAYAGSAWLGFASEEDRQQAQKFFVSQTAVLEADERKDLQALLDEIEKLPAEVKSQSEIADAKRDIEAALRTNTRPSNLGSLRSAIGTASEAMEKTKEAALHRAHALAEMNEAHHDLYHSDAQYRKEVDAINKRSDETALKIEALKKKGDALAEEYGIVTEFDDDVEKAKKAAESARSNNDLDAQQRQDEYLRLLAKQHAARMEQAPSEARELFAQSIPEYQTLLSETGKAAQEKADTYFQARAREQAARGKDAAEIQTILANEKALTEAQLREASADRRQTVDRLMQYKSQALESRANMLMGGSLDASMEENMDPTLRISTNYKGQEASLAENITPSSGGDKPSTRTMKI